MNATPPGFLARWIVITTAAEVVGFAAPAMVGVATANAVAPVQVFGLATAGLIEGAMLGWGQAIVLRRVVPVRTGRWMLLTAVAASVAYLLGLAPMTWLAGLTDLPLGAQIPVWVALGVALVATIGTAQWLELQRLIYDAAHWIWITGVGWLVGLGVFMAIATPLWQDGQPFALTLVIGLGAAVVMAASVATVTGVGLRWMLGRSPLRA